MTIEKQKDVEIEIIDDVDWGAVNVTKQHFIGPKRYIRASRSNGHETTREQSSDITHFKQNT
jgi:hypothetical protein